MEPRGAAGGVTLIGRLVCVVWTALPLYEVLVGVLGVQQAEPPPVSGASWVSSCHVSRGACVGFVTCVCVGTTSPSRADTLWRERGRVRTCVVCADCKRET